jgi:amidase
MAEMPTLFVCEGPANFTRAFPHDSRPFEQRTIPTPEGERPYDSQVGAQIIGPLHEDDTALTFAERLADGIGGFEPPPA